ncbi:MAG: hypothetical protein LUI05_09215 [Oscillospiraceae bacterium]|nr:hypothetical protein [Oscillospiraceae bacterium]
MNDQEKILTAILQNADMGTSSIRQIFPSVQDSALRNELRHQLAEYSRQHNEINRQMANLHLKGKPISPMAKAMGHVSIAMKTAADNSSEHLAEMLIQGTNMGIIEINKALNSADTASEKLKTQAKDLLAKEQRYLDRLKAYL